MNYNKFDENQWTFDLPDQAEENTASSDNSDSGLKQVAENTSVPNRSGSGYEKGKNGSKRVSRYKDPGAPRAAAGGARSTATVDLSQTYLDWAARNMAANGFAGAEHTFEKADVMRWITDARRSGRRFDLVFVDPPTFSNSKAMGKRTWDVQRDHVELLIGVSRLLSEEGEAVFSCNLRSFKPQVEELAKYGVEIEDISASTIPEDFARTPKIHKCYLVRRTEPNHAE